MIYIKFDGILKLSWLLIYFWPNKIMIHMYLGKNNRTSLNDQSSVMHGLTESCSTIR